MVSFLHVFGESLISPQLENLCSSSFPPNTHERPKDLVIGAVLDGSVGDLPCSRVINCAVLADYLHDRFRSHQVREM